LGDTFGLPPGWFEVRVIHPEGGSVGSASFASVARSDVFVSAWSIGFLRATRTRALAGPAGAPQDRYNRLRLRARNSTQETVQAENLWHFSRGPGSVWPLRSGGLILGGRQNPENLKQSEELAAGGIVPPAVELANGVLRTLTMTRTLKVASAVLAIGAIALGTGVFVQGMPNELAQEKVADVEQKPFPEQVRRALLGSWESTFPAGAPKSFRCVKHITPTHWTWVAYDRDTKVAFSTCGGTWTLKGDKYEETNEFATENMKHARGKAFAFSSKIDGDKWFVKGWPDLEIDVDEVWVRVKSGGL
jgi:hypothetical protein